MTMDERVGREPGASAHLRGGAGSVRGVRAGDRHGRALRRAVVHDVTPYAGDRRPYRARRHVRATWRRWSCDRRSASCSPARRPESLLAFVLASSISTLLYGVSATRSGQLHDRTGDPDPCRRWSRARFRRGVRPGSIRSRRCGVSHRAPRVRRVRRVRGFEGSTGAGSRVLIVRKVRMRAPNRRSEVPAGVEPSNARTSTCRTLEPVEPMNLPDRLTDRVRGHSRLEASAERLWARFSRVPFVNFASLSGA